MWRLTLFLLALTGPVVAAALPLEFGAPVAVTRSRGPGIFHHLDSAGRRNIAVAGATVAVVWEDERDGHPKVYFAKKERDATAFEPETVLSGSGEAFEPAIAALDERRFAIAWEEDGQVVVRVVGAQGAGPAFRVPSQEAVQPTLATTGDELLLAAAERSGNYARIQLHRLRVNSDSNITEIIHCAVDEQQPKDEQLYPALATQAEQVIVAWEDRRPGHTIIMASESVASEACRFTPPQRISLRPERGQKMPYGKGHGVTRVSLGAYGSGVLAAWADKRDFREGYDIYAAVFHRKEGFGVNERVQDAFGGVAGQWHPSVAGHADGSVVVAWDDDRDGDANVMMSWREGESWSEDFVLPGADGPGEQAHPTITFDVEGNLHAAWVERETVGGPTNLRYVFGRRLPVK